ncbi:hypothetical protein IMSHALPRED_008021 [Imshaugia aleurites]|uniref:Uncharacterized protein n=1 Tax=Imshaugia aleurites TaxID=172621 RepID=A0A8H3FYA5_9LECA|nr:hypothetical protein IMSHALPRED_008021 [Imshaugia aleurites]
MRYALDWCLFGFPQGDKETASDQCITACGRISNALEINIPNATASSTYDYCQNPDFLPNVGSCASCYKKVPNQLYLSNFLNTLGYACQNQPSPVLPFPVKPSDIFTYQPPSNFSTLGATSTSSHGLSHDARVAIAISVPVAVFLIFSLLLVHFYVHKNAPGEPPRHSNHHSNRQPNRNEKHVSKSTSGWSKTPPREGFHSRDYSSKSASNQAPCPAPLKPSKAAVPAPLRTRNSPIPFSRNYYQPTNHGLEQPSTTPPPATYTPEILPATRYSPPHPNPPSPEPRNPRPGPSKSGLVSWERIAIQNAQIRADLGPSPSPISPLTQAQIVPTSRSPSLRSSRSRHSRFPVLPAPQSPLSRESRHSALRSPAPAEQRHSALTSPLSRAETHPALRSPTLSEEMRDALRSPVETEYGPDTPDVPFPFPPRKERQSTDTPFRRVSPFALRSRPSTPFRQERQEAQEMVDRLERERRRGGEMVEREGVGAEGGAEGGGRGNWREGRRSSRADTPRPDDDDDDDGRARGVREGVVRSGSGKSRKEVRWSKDVDYEG